MGGQLLNDVGNNQHVQQIAQAAGTIAVASTDLFRETMTPMVDRFMKTRAGALIDKFPRVKSTVKAIPQVPKAALELGSVLAFVTIKSLKEPPMRKSSKARTHAAMLMGDMD